MRKVSDVLKLLSAHIRSSSVYNVATTCSKGEVSLLLAHVDEGTHAGKAHTTLNLVCVVGKKPRGSQSFLV